MTQLQDATVPIKYVGTKAEKHDTIHHTGTIWKPGQTLFYPAKLAKDLLNQVHSAVWRHGKREDVGAADAEMEAVVAAANEAVVEKPGETGSGAHPEDPVPQSELVKDRSKGATGARATLE